MTTPTTTTMGPTTTRTTITITTTATTTITDRSCFRRRCAEKHCFNASTQSNASSLDKAGKRTQLKWPDGYYVNFGYDALNRSSSDSSQSTFSGLSPDRQCFVSSSLRVFTDVVGFGAPDR